MPVPPPMAAWMPTMRVSRSASASRASANTFVYEGACIAMRCRPGYVKGVRLRVMWHKRAMLRSCLNVG